MFFKGVFIDPDGRGPGVLAGLLFLFQAIIEGGEYVASGDSAVFLDAFEVDEIFTGPEHVPSEAFGGSSPLFYAGDVFGERFFTGFTPEAAFLYFFEKDLIAHRGVFDGGESSIVDGVTEGWAPGTEGGGSGGSDFKMSPGAAPGGDFDHFQFRKQEGLG